MVSCGSLVAVQPPLIDRTALMGGGVRLGSVASESLVWYPALAMFAVLRDEKSLGRMPRLSNESYDKYMVWTELLT